MISQTFRYLKDTIQNLDIFKVINDNPEGIIRLSKKFEDCEKIIVIGTGGSSLGGKCLVNFDSCFYNKEPRVVYMENVDSRTFSNITENCDPEKTGIIVISKSGKTTETLTLFHTLHELWSEFDYQNKAIAITELSENNPLREFAESLGMEVVEHNPRIGGRFSVFSVVGLLPAALNGVDLKAFLNGAKLCINEVINANIPEECKIFMDMTNMNAAIDKLNLTEHVLFSYSDLMDDFGKWYTQLLAESLGKSENFGISPIRAIGTVDQHSMLQLFLGGPKNKLYTVITQRSNCTTEKIKNELAGKLCGRNIHDLMSIHQEATITALKNRAPVRVLEFEEINIETIGFLMALSFIEIITIAKLQGIDPFDQPAVEQVKVLVHNALEH